MIAVSNTTPLRYLLAIQQESVLTKLFEQILIPAAVFEELTAPGTPSVVQDVLRSHPAWISVRQIESKISSPSLESLDRGEREAILLAQVVRPDFLLLDEKVGRRESARLGLPLSGTLGVLERADVLGLIHDFAATLKSLKSSGFFLSTTLEKQLLARHTARRFRRS